MLCDINPFPLHEIKDDLTIDEEDARDNRNAILQKYTENYIVWVSNEDVLKKIEQKKEYTEKLKDTA